MYKKYLFFTIMVFIFILFTSGCEDNNQKLIIFEEKQIKGIDSTRLKVEDGYLYFDNINIGDAGTELELNEWHYGHEAVINKNNKVLSLRYAVSDAPAPYTDYLSKIFLLQKKELKEISVQNNFILEKVYGDENVIWVKGMYRSGRIFYWDVLYLYNINDDKVIRINDIINLNSVSINQVTNQYADITAWHNSDHHPITDEIPEDLSKKNYRIFNEGNFEVLE